MLFDGPIEQRSAFGSENDLIATALRFELVEEFVARAAGTGRVASDFGVAAGSALTWVSSASRNGAASFGLRPFSTPAITRKAADRKASGLPWLVIICLMSSVLAMIGDPGASAASKGSRPTWG